MYSVLCFAVTLLLATNTTGQTIRSHFCPAECNCINTTVNCKDKGLTLIPHVIPYHSKTLLLNNNKLKEARFSQDAYARYFLNIVSYSPANPFNELTFINLSGNQIEYLSDELFIYAHKVQKLILDNNLIDDLRMWTDYGIENKSPFHCMQELTELSVKNNRLQFPLVDIYFKGLHNLTKLDLTNNLIPAVKKWTFIENPKLVNLRLAKNKINLLQSGCFSHFENLKFLDLSHNLLNVIKPQVFGKLHQLRRLDLSYNKISSIPLNMEWFDMRNLILSHNVISQLEEAVFESLAKLEYVYVSSNQLSQMPVLHNTSSFIMEISHNLFDCSCPSWTSQSYIDSNITAEMNCETIGDFVRVRMSASDGTVCLVCYNSTTDTSSSQLEVVCGSHRVPERSSHIMITVILIAAVSVSLVAGVSVAAIIICRRRRNKMKVTENSQEREHAANSSQLSFRQRRRRTVRAVQHKFEESLRVRSGSDIEAISIHQYYSISVNGYESIKERYPRLARDQPYSVIHENVGATNPEQPGQSTSQHDGDRDTEGRGSATSTSTTISSVSTLSRTVDNIMYDEDYTFPVGQSVPDSRSVAKPIPKGGMVPSSITALQGLNNELSSENITSDGYEMPLSHSKSAYMDLH